MGTQKKSKDRLKGKRLFVYRAGRDGYTTISASEARYGELLVLAHLDDQALRDCARYVSWHGRAVDGQSWSVTVVSAMFAKLRRDHSAERLAVALEARKNEVELASQTAEKPKR